MRTVGNSFPIPKACRPKSVNIAQCLPQLWKGFVRKLLNSHYQRRFVRIGIRNAMYLLFTNKRAKKDQVNGNPVPYE
jgi:hypothetical protein